MKHQRLWFKILSAIISIVLIIHFGGDLLNKYSDDSNQPQTSYQRSKKRRNPNFQQVSLGMTQQQVIAKLGTPDDKSKTELTYNNDTLTFKDNKLTEGTPNIIKQAAIKQRQKAKLADENKQFTNQQNILKLNAQEFGQKDLQTVQNFVGDMYYTVYLGDSTAYAWDTPNGSLIRIDKPQYDSVSVYTYNRSTIGTQLYSGHTIVQQAPKQGTLYGNQ